MNDQSTLTGEATARPWRVFDDEFYSLEIVGPDKHTVATVYQCGGIREIAEAEANSRLIVAAVNAYSPEREAAWLAVVAALDATICGRCLNRIGCNDWPTEYGDWKTCSSCKAARAALADAVGEGKIDGK